MLKGKELGDAIKQAIDLKKDSGAIKSAAEVARHFGIQPPSLHGWIKRGTVAKDKLPKLWEYFSDVVGPEHWGLTNYPQLLSSNEKSDDAWLNALSLERYSFLKRMGEKLASMEDAEFRATEKIFDGADDAIKAGRSKEKGNGNEGK